MRMDKAWWALMAIFLAGLILRLLLVHPFDHLLGEDTYFHRDLVRFMIGEGSLAQFSISRWEEVHPYFLALSPKLRSYPFGYHLVIYPFAKMFGDATFRYLPSILTSFTPVTVYLFMKEFSCRSDLALAAAVLYTIPDVISYSVLLLPQGLGLLFLPLTLWLYLKTEYGGVVGAFFCFVHPFSCVAIMVAMLTLSLYRKEYVKFLKVFAISSIVIAIYSIITLTTSSPGSTFNLGLPEFVFYGADRYLSAFSVALLFPLGILYMKNRSEWYLLLMAFLFGIPSFFQISNLPPERMFNFLALFLSCIAAFLIRGLHARHSKAIVVGGLVVLSLFACTEVFGHIGPSNVEVASWEFVNGQTLDDALVMGWDRYPQIYTTERKIVYGLEDTFLYICPEAHMLGQENISKLILLDNVNVIYDNYVSIMTFNNK